MKGTMPSMVRTGICLAASLLAVGCRQPTEIVLRLEAPSASPRAITVKLQRSTPFAEDPETPPFVVAALDGPDLDLLVTPQGQETVLSLLPPDSGPSDLSVTTTADGFQVDPTGPQRTQFEEGSSVPLVFILTPVSTR